MALTFNSVDPRTGEPGPSFQEATPDDVRAAVAAAAGVHRSGALRDRGAVIQDELRNRISEDMNRTMYVLTVVASVLLPLSFVTGLLGINVDGMPGAKDAPTAFWIVAGGLAVVAAFQLWLFRRFRWL